MKAQVLQGNNVDVLKTFPDNHFDSVVTDPPYGIDFLGKAWDADTGSLETYQECLRVLKPGGHLLAFSAARTYHYLAVTVEQAGFEIRDQIVWIYSSGFPKSQDIGKNNGMPEWKGWGTSLKPAHEPICLARKPMRSSTVRNCQQWGVGALNIDATRIPSETLRYPADGRSRVTYGQSEPDKWTGDTTVNDLGRFPSNVIGDIPLYQKYFYCPKVSRAERHIGFDDATSVSNNHPTVKPIALMKYLIRLVTPAGGHVLDPFCGSGSTGCAAVELDREFTGCELDPAYVAIAQTRIRAWYEHTHTNTFNEIFEIE